MSEMTTTAPHQLPGAVVVPSPDGTWLWTGVRVSAAADLTEVRAYADLPERERLARAVAAQVAMISATQRDALEVRYVWDPATGTLACYVLTLIYRPTPQEAREAAASTLDRLAGSLDHVTTAPLSDAEISAALAPFPVHPDGAVEVRKKVLVERPQRPDAGVAYYVAVEPFAAGARDWSSFLSVLTAQRQPVAVSVGLAPVHLPPSFGASVTSAATAYARLARDGEFERGAMYHGSVQLTPDAFAVDAEKTYADAARRYSSDTFRIRVCVYSPAPLDDTVAGALGATVASTGRRDGQTHLTDVSAGSAFTLERPDASSLEVFGANVESLAHHDWGQPWPFGPGHAPTLAPLAWVVDADEAAAAFRLPIAVHGHLPAFAVRTVDPSLVSDYQPTGPHVVLGTQTASPSAATAAVELDELTKHTLVLGTTGSGKTNSTLALCRSLWADHRIPFLVLEPVNSERDDYRWLATLPGFEDMLVLTVGDESVSPLRLNPFEVPPGVRVSTHQANLRSAFDTAFGLWDPLPAIYAKALRLTYARAGYDGAALATEDDLGHWPTLPDFISAITEVTDNIDYAGEVRSNILAASRLRAESLAEGPCASTLTASRSYPITELLNRPVVIELAPVGDDKKEQSLVTALLLMVMTEYYKAHRTTSDLSHVTVIEEAHRLLGNDNDGGGSDAPQGNAAAQAAAAFANTLAENRKYGEGLVIVEQDPSKLVPDAYKNTNTKVVHRLPSDADRELIGGTMHLADDQKRHASSLKKMQAYVFHAAMNRPALVQVDDVRAADARARGLAIAPLASNADLRERFERFAAQVPQVRAALAMSGECGACAHRCVWRDVVRSAITDAGVADYKAHLGTYRTTTDRAAWWAALVELVDGIGAPAAPARPVDRGHWLTGVLLEVHSRAFANSGQKWASMMRERMAVTPA